MLAVPQLPLALLTRGRLTRNPLVINGCLFLSGIMAVMAAMSVLAILAEIAPAFWFFSDEVRDFLVATTRGNVLGFVLIGMMLFSGPLFMGSPFYVPFGAQRCGRRVGGAVSRQREFLADAGVGALGVTGEPAEKPAAPPERIGGPRSPSGPATPLLSSAGVVSYIRVGERSAVMYERPDSASAVQARLATGTILALRGAIGDFI